MKKNLVIEICSGLLVLLWVYASLAKLADTTAFLRELKNQVFPKETLQLLFYLIPISELLVAGLLILKRTRTYGLLFSLVLMLIFTAYIILILYGYYDRVPCSCGGVLSTLGWRSHLIFNLFFTAVAAIGLICTIKEGR